MKISCFGWFAVGSVLAGSAWAQTPAAGTNASAAHIQFQVTTFDFGKLSSGQAARHDFIFTNTGSAVLEISAVRPSCGCTTAGEWSKSVEPGKTGTIPLQFNSAGFSGTVVKTATVTCNDPATPTLTLQLSGNVWREIDTMPQFAVLNASVETATDAKATVKVVNNGELPLTINGLEVNNPMFAAEFKTNQPGKEFEVSIKVVPPITPNSTHGIITLKTSSTNMPQVQITAMLMLQPVISVAPPQITVPSAPTPGNLLHTISIRNSGTNVVKLNDPTVSDSRFTATLKETEPGRVFNVDINIPQGFEAKPGQNNEVVIKTSHPLYPELRIPIIQPLVPPTPAVPAAVAPAPAAAGVPTASAPAPHAH